MILRQTLEKPVQGYWNGGERQVFDWMIDGSPRIDAKGQFVKIGSWGANHWYHVALGKTEKLTLRNAKLHLLAITRMPSKFEYIEEG